MGKLQAKEMLIKSKMQQLHAELNQVYLEITGNQDYQRDIDFHKREAVRYLKEAKECLKQKTT